MPLLFGLFLTTFPGLGGFVLVIVSTSIVAVWLQKSKTRFEYVATSIYSIVILLHIGFVVWFNVTRQLWNL